MIPRTLSDSFVLYPPLLSACKVDNNSPLHAHNDTCSPLWEVYLPGLESGNGDYSLLEVKINALSNFQIRWGWSTPVAVPSMSGESLTWGKNMKVTDYTALWKVVFLTVKLWILRNNAAIRGHGLHCLRMFLTWDAACFGYVSYVNNHWDAYFFKQDLKQPFHPGWYAWEIIFTRTGNGQPGQYDTHLYRGGVEHINLDRFIVHHRQSVYTPPVGQEPEFELEHSPNRRMHTDIARASTPSYIFGEEGTGRKQLGFSFTGLKYRKEYCLNRKKNTVGSDVRFVITGAYLFQTNITCEYATPADKVIGTLPIFVQNRGRPIYK